MNPIFSAALGSILRHVLTMGATYLVTKGVWSETDASVYVTAAAMGLVSVVWAVWQKYRTHLTILKALDLPAGSDPDRLQER